GYHTYVGGYEIAFLQLGLSLDTALWYAAFIASAVTLGCLIVAALIVRRRSDDWMALFVSLWCVSQGVMFSSPQDTLVAVHPVWHWPLTFLTLWNRAALLLIAYLFPNGQFVPRWTRWPAVLWVALTLVSAFFPALPFDPNLWPMPLQAPFLLGMLGSAAFA